jgi:hypothetical protein
LLNSSTNGKAEEKAQGKSDKLQRERREQGKMEGLRRYLESSQLADVEVEADGRLFPAHRIVLARHSLLLRQLFQNLHDSPHFALPHRLIVRSEKGEHTTEWTKGCDDVMEGANKIEVVLPPGAWPLVASFMYQGSVLLHPNNVLPLFDSAARLQARSPLITSPPNGEL